MIEEGIQKRWNRHRRNLEFVKRIEAMGMHMHVAAGDRLWNLNTP